MLNIFYIGHLCIVFGKNIYSSPLPIMQSTICVFIAEVLEFLFYSKFKSLIRYIICKHFLPFYLLYKPCDFLCFKKFKYKVGITSIRSYSAATAANSLQSCPTLCDPIDGSAPGSPIPGILQARTLEWVAISFSNVWKWKVKVKLLNRVRLVVTPWTGAYQAPPVHGVFQARGLEWGAIAFSEEATLGGVK